ncbi:MAG: methyltransferase domain-containing protein [Desulfosarcinaceae bacterium]|nr:methyltransferase domain-containing protein [Desulfosarcinaceae bacterium]
MTTDCQRWNATDYAENSGAQLEWARELIAKLDLKGDEALLDIGCGDGKVSARLARVLPLGRVHGIDLSADMIQLARERFDGRSHPNLRFQQMDAARIQLARGFDVAFSTAALHWVADHPAVLRGVRACLKPGGRLLFQMGGRGNAQAVYEALQTVVPQGDWRPHLEAVAFPYHFLTPAQYEAWLPACGFRLRRAELIPKEMRHPDREGLKGWLRTTWFPYTDRLPEEMRDPFLEAVVARYLEHHPPAADGRTRVQMVRLEIEAETV